jgi:membrane protein YdbS with pleckstrin-like domain
MSADIAKVKRAGMIATAVCVTAFAAAVACFMFYFKAGQEWARIAAVLALAVGFGAQIWFVASLRRPKPSSIGKGA